MLYHLDPHHWPESQGHRLWNFKFKFLVKVFFSTFLLWKQLRQIVGRTSVSLVALTWGMNWRSAWAIFHRFCLIHVSWSLFDVCTSYFETMSQYDTTFDLKINVDHGDLYFMVQWFCLISWRLFDIWTPYFGIMTPYDPVFDLNKFVGHFDFALYLENYSVAKRHTLGLWVSMTQHLTAKYLYVIVTYISWSIELAWCLEDEHHTLGLWVSMTQHLTSK